MSKVSSQSASFEIEIPTDEYRSHPIPGFGSLAKVGSCFVRVSDIPNLDGWLSVNPRVPKRSKDVLVGPTVRGIKETLEESPADMALKNLGLYLLVDSAEHERRSGGAHALKITLTDPARHGLANGGHTYAVIRECLESPDAFTDLRDAYVRLHVFQGIPQEKVAAMAEGLNRSRQVDDPSLMNLRGLFDTVKSIMDGVTGSEKISYRQGDPGEIYVTEILMYLELFNCERFKSDRHPSGLYRYQKKMLDMFEKDKEATPSPLDLLIPKLPEILVLSDKIRQEVPAAAKKCCNFELGRMKPDSSKKERAGSEKNKGTPLYFLGTTMDHRIPTGWLLPMLAAFRANVRWDLAKKRFDWIIPLDELLPAVITDLVRVCVTEHRDNGEKPEDVGMKSSVYSQCFDKVELYLLRQSR